MKTILKKMVAASACSLALLGLAINASALPALQLDIVGGTYDGSAGVESTLTSSDQFTLQALLKEDQTNKVCDTYFIAVAVVPSMELTDAGNYGSFTMDGTSYNVTADMDYGTPPLDALFPDLGSHGVYATFYKEISFTFDGTTMPAYNVQTGVSVGGSLYVANFNFDVSGLAGSGVELHFDLYNENVKKSRNRTEFAPYSHDAGTTSVPEPGTLILLGSGLCGLALMRRRRRL